MEAYRRGKTILEIIQGDITELVADIIVNAANSSLLGGGGVDGAIHKAGGEAILQECIRIRNEKGGCPAGEAVITTAGNLKASYVIHTVGPIWKGGMNEEEKKLRNCYRNTLKLANEYGAKSIAYPNISTGVYQYPKEEAARIALDEIFRYLGENEMTVEKIILVCYDSENYRIYKKHFIDYLNISAVGQDG
jgi:O-acetyl-ADP-ribose deacetylase (regulator of RNase III)